MVWFDHFYYYFFFLFVKLIFLSAGGDTVHVWSCNDIGEAPKAKEGEVLVHHKAKVRFSFFLLE